MCRTVPGYCTHPLDYSGATVSSSASVDFMVKSCKKKYCSTQLPYPYRTVQAGSVSVL